MGTVAREAWTSWPRDKHARGYKWVKNTAHSTPHASVRRSPQPSVYTLYVCMVCVFSECVNVEARCPLGACTTHGSVVPVVTSTLSAAMA
jgi:hypothetical protein